MKIGLTGGIASGKNFVAGLFAERGCYTIDADEVARIVMRPGEIAYLQIVEKFGQPILLPDGDIDRTALRSMIIADKSKKLLLESIVHPAVIQYIDKWYKTIKGTDDKAIAIHHAPLLLEAGGAKNHDVIVLVWCSEDTQKKRLAERGHPPYEDAIALMKSQMPAEEKLKYAHHVINNDGTPVDTAAEVDRVLNLIKMIRKAGK
jgi:dephospho-CoA kinase